MTWIVWGSLVVANIPVYLIVGKLFFKNGEEFGEAIAFWFTPDIFSAFSGEYWDDVWAEIKLSLLLVCCGAIVYGEHYGLVYFFPSLGA